MFSLSVIIHIVVNHMNLYRNGAISLQAQNESNWTSSKQIFYISEVTSFAQSLKKTNFRISFFFNVLNSFVISIFLVISFINFIFFVYVFSSLSIWTKKNFLVSKCNLLNSQFRNHIQFCRNVLVHCFGASDRCSSSCKKKRFFGQARHRCQ